MHCHVRDSEALRSYLPKSTRFVNDKDRTAPTHTDSNWLIITPIHCLLMNFGIYGRVSKLEKKKTNPKFYCTPGKRRNIEND